MINKYLGDLIQQILFILDNQQVKNLKKLYRV